MFWRDMGVVNLPSGQPTMQLTGGAAERLKAILPPGTEPFIHLTITDEGAFAQAFVVIEARPALRAGQRWVRPGARSDFFLCPCPRGRGSSPIPAAIIFELQ